METFAHDGEKKVAFIVPAYFEVPENPKYEKVAGYFEDAGYDEVVKVPITYARRTMSHYVEELKPVYIQQRGDINAVFGFSFGAMIGFISAPELQPDYLLLASLSPYFAEDLNRRPKDQDSFVKNLGKRRVNNLKAIYFDQIAEAVDSKTYLWVGSNEDEVVHYRANVALDSLPKNSVLVEVPGVGHDLSEDAYQASVKEVIQQLA